MRSIVEQIAVLYATEIEKLQAEVERLRAVLEWLNRRGGLGHDVHERISKELSDIRSRDDLPLL